MIASSTIDLGRYGREEIERFPKHEQRDDVSFQVLAFVSDESEPCGN
jgi:hypothetical protein